MATRVPLKLVQHVLVSGEVVCWGFHKYLIGRDGHIAATFATEVEPTDPRVIAAIVRELGSE